MKGIQKINLLFTINGLNEVKYVFYEKNLYDLLYLSANKEL